MDIQLILEKTLSGLGYELVDNELTAQGDLRVFIDFINPESGSITIDDCANVSRHLSRVLMVEDVDYRRLEISSPGLDRPLKKAADFARFTGQLAKIKTRLPIDGQKNFCGRLNSISADHIISLTPEETNPVRQAKRAAAVAGKTVFIELNNIDKARLKPEF